MGMYNHVMRLVAFLLAMLLSLPFIVKSFHRTRITDSITLCTRALVPEKEFEIERVCSDKSFPTYSTLTTRETTIMPPYIVHIKALKEYENCEQLLTKATGLSICYIRELLQFGAIYMSTSIPGKLYHKRGKEVLVDMTRAKRLDVSKDNDVIRVTKGSYLRVHANPRRYHIANINIKDCIVAVSNNVIYINKPSGFPVVPGVDNKIENLEHQIGQLDSELYKQLYALGRLDSCTSGIVAFALDKKTAAKMHNKIANRKVKKTYKLLISTQVGTPFNVPLGLVQHCFRRKVKDVHEDSKPSLLASYDPHLLTIGSKVNGFDWQLCELELLNVTLLSQNTLNMGLIREIQKKCHIEVTGDTLFYELSVNLITGRTHQVRLQFAALGFPLVGDSRYYPVSGMLATDDGKNPALFGKDPNKVALTCSALQYEGETEIETDKYWWRI